MTGPYGPVEEQTVLAHNYFLRCGCCALKLLRPTLQGRKISYLGLLRTFIGCHIIKNNGSPDNVISFGEVGMCGRGESYRMQIPY